MTGGGGGVGCRDLFESSAGEREVVSKVARRSSDRGGWSEVEGSLRGSSQPLLN